MLSQDKKTKIAVDAMGGDFAPANVVAGAIQALTESKSRFEVILVGREDEIKSELKKFNTNDLAFTIAAASEVIDMHDSPTTALKQKKDSSLIIGMTLHKEGKVDAFISAGNTGAVMSVATIILGRVRGVSRPTIGAIFPTEEGPCLIVDAGANVDCKPQHLLEFGMMGSIYVNYIFGYSNPKVGILSIGEEDSKGNESAIEAHKLLKSSKINFIGNIEGRDILNGKAQVIVCDGFVGNILLKFGESFLGMLKFKLRSFASKNLLNKIKVLSMYGTLKNVLKDFDYQEHGGVPLLGVNGIIIIGHGSSTPKAIKNMIFTAEKIAKKEINQQIAEAMSGYKHE